MQRTQPVGYVFGLPEGEWALAGRDAEGRHARIIAWVLDPLDDFPCGSGK